MLDCEAAVVHDAVLFTIREHVYDNRRFGRDAQDLGLIMEHYLDAGNQDRVYSDQGDCFDLLNEDFDHQKASARMLGRDVGRLLTDTSRPIFERVLLEAQDSERADALTTTMIRNNANYHGDPDTAVAMLEEMLVGITGRDR